MDTETFSLKTKDGRLNVETKGGEEMAQVILSLSLLLDRIVALEKKLELLDDE